MSDVKEKKDVMVISTEVTELSDKIKPNIVVDANGAVSEKEGADIFMANAPAEIKEHITAVQKYESLFATSLLRAVGDLAVDHVREHRDTKRVNGVIKTGESALAVNYVPPTGKKADGTMKDPAVAIAYRRPERADHRAAIHEINMKTKEIFN